MLENGLGSADIRLLTAFNAVMIEGNLSGAARRLNVSQSTISQSLARLRELLGDDLFERTGRGVKPTPRACQIAAPVRQALALLQEAMSRANSFDPANDQRTFFLSLRGQIAEGLAVELAGSAAGWPGIAFYTISRTAEEAAESLRFGEPEIAIDIRPATGTGVHIELLAQQPIVLLARRGHPLLRGPLDLKTYRALGHVGLSRIRPADEGRAAAELPPMDRRFPISVSNSALAAKIVAETDLAYTSPEGVARRLASTYGLEVHELAFASAPASFYMSWHERFDDDAGHRWMRDTLRSMSSLL